MVVVVVSVVAGGGGGGGTRSIMVARSKGMVDVRLCQERSVRMEVDVVAPTWTTT